MIVTGIYIIRNKVTGNVRIGSASGIAKRFSSYKADMRNNNGNAIMQFDFNMYGEESFDFSVLEECKKEDLFLREQFWLKEYKATAKYNINNVNKITKKIHTAEEELKLKETRSKVTSGSNNGHCTTLTEQLASEILWLKMNTKMRQTKIAAIYEIRANLVSRIGNDRWLNVTEVMPVWYKTEKVVLFGENTTLFNTTLSDVVSI